MNASEKARPSPDPLIDEVRARRRALFADCGHDLEKLVDAIRRVEAEHPEKVVDRRKIRIATGK